MICAIYSRKNGEQNGVADEAKSVTRLEIGWHDPRLSTLRKLAKSLGVKPGRPLN